MLSDTLYMGDYWFNVRDSKAKTKRAPEEWVKTEIPALVDAALFERVRAKRESRAPGKKAPRVVSSPTLLTGLIKCGICGSSMTLATGKSGAYKYYKCTRRQNQGNHACTSHNIPMEKLDALVLDRLAEKVLAPDRLQAMMAELRKRLKSVQGGQQAHINEISRQIRLIEERQQRLLEAIETGTIALDEMTQRRSQQLKAAREALFIELAGVRRDQSLPALEHLKASQVDAFGKVLRQKLLGNDSRLAKSYLNLLVDEIVVADKEATIKGSHSALASTLQQMKKGTNNQVPSFMSDWCPRHESNV